MYTELNRTTVRLTGKDRVAFLQNFCTADVKTMVHGEVREAFILNPKGKIHGHVLLLCDEEYLDLNTVPEQGDHLIQHLDRYLLREDVQLTDTALAHLFCFSEPTDPRFEISENRFQQLDEVRIAKCEVAGPGVLLTSESSAHFSSFLDALGEFDSDQSQLQLHRVQSGTPWYGADSSSDTLPQELQRDEKAISFTKGCYLGQETVARIDALGRVNKLLVRIKSSQSVKVGDKLRVEEKETGVISSVAQDGQEYYGLAMVRRASANEGIQLSIDEGTVEVY